MSSSEGTILDNNQEDFDFSQHWKLTQWFRKMDEEVDRTMQAEDFDHISALQFDEEGRFLATGDHSGNIVVLENDGPGKNGAAAHFAFFNEFSSHYKDYNFSKGEQVDPRIADLKFGPSTNDSVFLLATSDTEIKLWRIQDQEQYNIVNWNFQPSQPIDDDYFNESMPEIRRQEPFRARPSPLDFAMQRAKPAIKKLKIPTKVVTEVAKVCYLRRSYSTTCHDHSITSIDVTADKLNFLSADFFTVNLWDFFVGEKSYNLIDRIPSDPTQLNELINSMNAHPTESNQFLYTTSSGNIHICDMRTSSNSELPAHMLSHRPPDQGEHSQRRSVEDEGADFLEDVVCTVSDAKFSKGGKFIISRDYMSVRIWDVTMPRDPVETIFVHEYLRDKVYDLYSNEYVLDAFQLGMSSRGDVVTGSYGNYFHILDFGAMKDTFIQAGAHGHKVAPLESLRNQQMALPVYDGGRSQSKLNSFANFFTGGRKKRKQQEELSRLDSMLNEELYPHNIPVEKIDFSKKMINCAWHPGTNTVAVAGENNVFVYGKV